MDLTIKGITEEEYGLWSNRGVTEQLNQENYRGKSSHHENRFSVGRC